jgi:serine/threonine protein kinase
MIRQTSMVCASESDAVYPYIIAGQLGELLEHWEFPVSPVIVDLLNRMFQENPEDRPSPRALLQHPLFAQQPCLQKPASPCVYHQVLSIPRHFLTYSGSSALATPFSPMTDSEDDDDDEMDYSDSDESTSLNAKNSKRKGTIKQIEVVADDDDNEFFYFDVANGDYQQFEIPN